MVASEDGIQGIFNVGTGVETSVNQLFKNLVEITGSTVKEMYGPERRGEQLRSCLDASHLNKATEWKTDFTLKGGLEKTAAYFKDALKIRD